MNYEGGSDFRKEGKRMKDDAHLSTKLHEYVKYFIFPISYYIVTVLIFVLAKMVFMFACREGHAFTLADMGDVVKHGLSLDLSTALYFLIVPFLISIISIWWKSKILTIILKVYSLIISLAFALAFVADTSLYPFWGFKLDASCLQYLETPNEATASVTGAYLFWRILVFIVIVICIYFLYRWIISLFAHQQRKETLNVQWSTFIIYLLFIPIIVIGIRGGIDESTTNIGQVYYSQDQFLNHSAVNPVFSFLSSISKSGNYIVSYDYMSEQKCSNLTNRLFFTNSNNADTLLTTQRPNIVLIVMESCGGQFTSLGGHSEITPNLNRLVTEGISFSECYANSWRTDKGMVSILSGYPSFPVTSVMKIPEKSRKLPSITRSLQKAGYRNTFYYGGDINFTNMRSYVLGIGYDFLRWKADYSLQDQSSCRWGVNDETMFQSLLEDIKSEKSEHWMKTLLTLSSHEPWDVPTHNLDDEVYNAFNYLDNCIGRFVNDLRKSPIWDNTLVIILPDHGYRYKGVDEMTRIYNHIPMIWIGGAVRKPTVIDRICNQSDLAATLLGQMGIAHDDFRFSRDVISSDYRYPLAYHNSTSCVSVIDSAGFIAYDLDAQTLIANESTDTERLLEMARALLQLTSHDLLNK